ncbi:glyoxylase I 4-like [Humulus lupulus]|uniref:glyoxylase I 4-like n=1 Tax=Humulus lupulus TaxID=3486 RepID=UPI002B405459|nr:glyoxylase I 4-like [Humulus lupulus]
MQKKDADMEAEAKGEQPPLMALNHVSRLCRNVEESIDFYTKVLGFAQIERPPAFDFDGAGLLNCGVRVHLVQSKDLEKLPEAHKLDPMDNHISFHRDKKNGTVIDQLFFDDSDGFMIENLKLVPAGSLGKIKLPFDHHNPPVEVEPNDQGNNDHK